ncbi:hypothetical protein QAD02_014826 [Eretmocerus hayati]|uniref:Uncharacterized protein n=1 Tax=Eretmocerus hayati TaxID=131215 RepID=A0ACC2P8U9_9HYME|nr:hypothetical protein QAD02_014826 [Eretmocerus hayati]
MLKKRNLVFQELLENGGKEVSTSFRSGALEVDYSVDVKWSIRVSWPTSCIRVGIRISNLITAPKGIKIRSPKELAAVCIDCASALGKIFIKTWFSVSLQGTKKALSRVILVEIALSEKTKPYEDAPEDKVFPCHTRKIARKKQKKSEANYTLTSRKEFAIHLCVMKDFLNIYRRGRIVSRLVES